MLGLTTLIALVTKRVVTLLAGLAGLIGLVDVFCMSNIYINASVITWMHINTLFMFYGSVLILGAVLAMLLLVPAQRQYEARRLVGLAVAAVVLAVVARLVEQPSWMSFLAQARSSDSVTFPLQPLAAFDALAGVRLATWIIMAAGAALFAVALRQTRSGMVKLGCVLLVVAEIMARYTFFSLS